MNIKTPLLLTALGAGVLAGQTAQAQVASALTAADTSAPDAGLNLTSYVNIRQGNLDSVWNPSYLDDGLLGDSFTVMNRTDSVIEDVINETFDSTIPFAQADDSVSLPIPPDTFDDTLGIIGETDTAPFFGVTDTNNSVSGTDPQVATWTFDISGATSDVEITVDLAAMGDFESSNDLFNFNASIDGGATFTPLGAFTVDQDFDDASYTMDDGTVVLLNDPLLFNGTILTNSFQNFSLGTIAGSAAASELILTFDATTDGGSEALVFRNIVIDEAAALVPGDADGDGDVDDTDLGIAISNFTGPVGAAGGKTRAEGDVEPNIGGDGDVDDSDIGVMISEFTGPLAPVPEPTSLALLGLGGLLVARRRRG